MRGFPKGEANPVQSFQHGCCPTTGYSCRDMYSHRFDAIAVPAAEPCEGKTPNLAVSRRRALNGNRFCKVPAKQGT